MVKKKTKKANLSLIRKQIDEVDNSILKLLSKRANLVVEAGESKENIGDTSYYKPCLLYTSPSPRDRTRSRMPSSA